MIVLGHIKSVPDRFPAFSTQSRSTMLRRVGKVKTLAVDDEGNVSTSIYYRHLLYIALCLATFREEDEIIRLALEEMHVQITSKHVQLVQKWMSRLKLDPEQDLFGKQKRWGEIYEHFKEARQGFLDDFSEEPLAHPRGRFMELKELYFIAKQGGKKVLFTYEHAKGADGEFLFQKNGKPALQKVPVLVDDPDVQTAANVLKQIAIETGGFVQKTEVQHVHSLRDYMLQQKEQRRLEKGNDERVDKVVEAQFTDITPVSVRLPSPTEDTEEQHTLP